ncbi:MAG TPA: GerMN domain-containing protein [Gemmatimonadales bacterium]|nr:GerMN domain-containing protein [Gemmatimonadales bacterium]
MLTTTACDLLRSLGSPSGSPRVSAEQQIARSAPRDATAEEVTIYLPRLFADGTLGLQGVPRPIDADRDPAWEVLQALIRGPDGEERAADFQYALDRRTRALGVRVEGGTGTIEFGEGLERVHGRPFSELVYWSIVYTMTEVPGVDRVALTHEGRRLATLGSPPFDVPSVASRAEAPSWARPRREP